MSLYSSNIQLLQRPSRDFFSKGPELTRATLPDFATVAELSQFTNRLFNWHLDVPSLYLQSIFGCSLIFLGVVIIALIMARRVYEGKFWLIRLIRKPSGVIVVPNPMLAFLLMAGLYAIVFAPFFLTACRQYELHTGPPKDITLWFTMPWLCLSFGLIWAVFGTYFATPDSTLDESERAPLGRFLGRANVVNALAILLPTAIAIATAIPSIICNSRWEEAVAMEKRWQLEYASFPSFTQEMVQQSQLIWYLALKAERLYAIILVIWTTLAFTMSLAYCICSLRLIFVVRQDLARANKVISNGNQTVINASASASCNVNSTTSIPPPTSLSLVAKEPIIAESQSNKKSLEQALVQIYVQLIAIAPAAACFGTIAMALALTCYGKFEQPSKDGGNELEAYLGGILLSLMYAICVFGGINILTVGYKTYEPVFTAAIQSRSGTTGQVKFADIVKGPDHIRSTFFSSHVTTQQQRQQQHQQRRCEVEVVIETYEELRMSPTTRNDVAEWEARTWDIEAKLDLSQ